ncbi:hypothetical protein [Vreelandella sp. V005]
MNLALHLSQEPIKKGVAQEAGTDYAGGKQIIMNSLGGIPIWPPF